MASEFGLPRWLLKKGTASGGPVYSPEFVPWPFSLLPMATAPVALPSFLF